MNALQAAAVEAVEKASADGDLAGSLKIKALKFLRDATGLSLPECVPAIEYAMARRRVLARMTRADKERAVAEMAKGLAAISENYVHASLGEPGAGDPKWFARKQELMRKAIVRVAMARTVD